MRRECLYQNGAKASSVARIFVAVRAATTVIHLFTYVAFNGNILPLPETNPFRLSPTSEHEVKCAPNVLHRSHSLSHSTAQDRSIVCTKQITDYTVAAAALIVRVRIIQGFRLLGIPRYKQTFCRTPLCCTNHATPFTSSIRRRDMMIQAKQPGASFLWKSTLDRS